MKLETEEIQQLLIKYSKGECTDAEKALLESWYLKFEDHTNALSPDRIEEIVSQALQNIPRDEESAIHRKLWTGIATIAASVVLAVGVWFYFDKTEPTTAQHYIQDIAPGGNKAVLTLSNGQQIVLTGAKNGIIANQGQTAIQKSHDGQVVYKSGDAATDKGSVTTVYNTLSTPIGGQYRLMLADGTIAMLDAASSIKYPVAFSGKERRVEITGQVYFEVVHDAKKPFRVVAGNQTIEDIGTHFNVNAYEDERAMRTTLVEGKIAVFINQQKVILMPGQQAVMQQNLSSIQTKAVDIDEAVAWKNGYFVFEHENIRSIMTKLSRWYNIEPEYADGITEIGFGGTVSRNKNISEVLRVLQLTGTIHFKIEGRRVKVMP